MNLRFVIGTAAELIKIYPLIHEAEQRKLDWKIILTGQSSTNFWKQANDFGIPTKKIIETNPRARDLKNSISAFLWFLRAVFIDSFKVRKFIKKIDNINFKNDYLIVHGDTLSTLVGVIYGKLLRMKIIHVEAGMRSHNWKSPFPEELTRRIVSQLANKHMCPDENAKKNLYFEDITQDVVVTNGNTIVDTLRLALTGPKTIGHVLVNIHRFENLNSANRWNEIINLIVEVAQQSKVIFILMPNTEEKIKNDQATYDRLIKAGVHLQPRLPFKDFVKLLEEAKFVLSDGGSNQQECHYIGKPCLILRDVTESTEGIGGSCVVSRFDSQITQNFIKNYKDFERPRAFPGKRPTDIIFENI